MWVILCMRQMLQSYSISIYASVRTGVWVFTLNLNCKTSTIIRLYFQVKQKKQQKESERQSQVMAENLILLRHLSEISISKRVDDANDPKDKDTKQIHWKDYFSSILLMRKQQVARLKRQLAEMERQAQHAGKRAGKKVEGHDQIIDKEAGVKAKGHEENKVKCEPVEPQVKVEINGEEVVEGNNHDKSETVKDDEDDESHEENSDEETKDEEDGVQGGEKEERSTDDFFD